MAGSIGVVKRLPDERLLSGGAPVVGGSFSGSLGFRRVYRGSSWSFAEVFVEFLGFRGAFADLV